MYQFFVEDEQVVCEANAENTSLGEVRIIGNDVNHIKNVLRMRGGERVRISDATGRAYFCHLEQITEEEVIAVIDSMDEKGTELANQIYLFQGLPKSDKMELIIQKATELGVYQVIPVAMRNCVVKLDAKKAESKVKRWQTIAESAAKQSKRTVIPEVKMPVSWKEALHMAEALNVKLVPYENERGMEATRQIMEQIKPGESIGIFIGPEGGFADDEITGLSQEMHRISLGRRILRTETAGLATLAMLVYQLDE